jgi:hypothetical protein
MRSLLLPQFEEICRFIVLVSEALDSRQTQNYIGGLSG